MELKADTMAAPTVTRPLATPPDTSNPSGLNVEEISRWAKWVVLASIAAGVVSLVVIGITYMSQQRRIEELRQSWDEVFLATQDKTKLNDRIQALETLAPKIAGTPAHAYIVMELGNIYFEQAVNPKKAREERAEALEKATKLYELIATNEPFKSNDTFGPAATRAAAACYEQTANYDAAIKLMKDALAQPDIEKHYLYNPMVAQLGREYWLRSLAKIEKKEDPEPDRKEARTALGEALRNVGDKKDEQQQGTWHAEAEFIKAIIDKPGKALPDGKVPPEKAPPAPTPAPGDRKTDVEKKDDAKKPEAEAKKTDDKKADDKKTDEKKDDKKPDIKKDEAKKDGSIQLPNSENDPSVPANASGHVSFSQIQKMMKEGRPAFCNCPRCQAGNAPPAGVRMAD